MKTSHLKLKKNRAEEENSKKGRYSYVRFGENHEKMVKSWENERKIEFWAQQKDLLLMQQVCKAHENREFLELKYEQDQQNYRLGYELRYNSCR